MDTTVGNARQHLAVWFERQRITSWSEESPRYYGLRALALATVREARDLPVTTPRTLVRAAFAGGPVPRDILSRAARRNRAEQGVNRPRAALIKLALLSQSNDHQEDYMVQLDSGNTDQAYLCGRLLAVLERAQRAAIRNLNTTIVDRFYGTASTAPQSVFSRLIRGSRPTSPPWKGITGARTTPFKRSWKSSWKRCVGIKVFPKTLNLEQQGHVCAGLLPPTRQRPGTNEEASGRRRDAQEQGGDAGSENGNG